MNYLTFEEMICFAKIYSVFAGMASPESISKLEKDLAFEAMKKIAYNRDDWTLEKKELYKALVDIAKEQTKLR